MASSMAKGHLAARQYSHQPKLRADYGLHEPLIDAFKLHENRTFAQGQIRRHFLRKRHTAEAGHQNRQIARFILSIGKRAGNIGAQHHARATARQRVVHRAMATLAKCSQIMGLAGPCAGFQHPPRQAGVQAPETYPETG